MARPHLLVSSSAARNQYRDVERNKLVIFKVAVLRKPIRTYHTNADFYFLSFLETEISVDKEA